MSKQAYFNFINTLGSEYTKREYNYKLERFLKYAKLDLGKFLKLKPQLQENLVIKYLAEMKVSKSSKNGIFHTIKHACEVNDVVLNWPKIKKFVRSTHRTGNEIAGRDRGYTHSEIQQILTFCDQRLRTAFLLLSSCGCRIGALGSMKVGDLEKINDIYKITVYAGEPESYTSFVTPEATKEIDAYLEFRKRRGEKITSDSYVIVKKFRPNTKTQPLIGDSLRSLLQETIENSGLREVDHENPHKRKQVQLLHGLRKYTTKQLVDSQVRAKIREMLLGHKIGLASVYYKPTEQDMLNEYMKAVPLLTISDEERVKFKLEEHIRIDKSRVDRIEATLKRLQEKHKKR